MNLLKYAVPAMALAISTSALAQDSLGELVKNFKSPDQLCVGYKTSKDATFFGRTDVIGTHCADVAIQLKNQNEMQLTFFPSFESGNGMRDRHVTSALSGDNKTPIIVSLSIDGLKSLPENDVTLSGTISILGNETPIQVLLSKLGDSSYGAFVQTKFSELKVERPQIGPFGIGGSVNEDLILFGQMSAEKAKMLIQEK